MSMGLGLGLGVCGMTSRLTMSPGAAIALDWEARVAAQGSSVSGATLSAVSEFFDDLIVAGIESKILRVNLFCGDDLTAARVPQKVGGGAAIETNNGFVEGDYVETGASGGITGDGTSYLETGWVPDTELTSSYDTHLGVYAAAEGTAFESWAAAHSHVASRRLWMDWASTSGSPRFITGDVSTALLESASPISKTGFILGTARASNDASLYDDGTEIDTDTDLGLLDVLPTDELNVFRSSGNSPSDARLCGYSVGVGLTATEVTSYTTAMEKFQDALGRGVVA